MDIVFFWCIGDKWWDCKKRLPPASSRKKRYELPIHSFSVYHYYTQLLRAYKAARPSDRSFPSFIPRAASWAKFLPLYTNTQTPLLQEKIKLSNCLYYFQTLATKHRCSLLRIKGRVKVTGTQINLIPLWIIWPHCLKWPLSLKKKRIFRLHIKANEIIQWVYFVDMAQARALLSS